MTKANICGAVELKKKWRLMCTDDVEGNGVSLSTTRTSAGIEIPRTPATILRDQIDAGVYDEDLYAGDALTRIDQDLWKKDWWYTLTFDVPEGHERYTLQFDGLSYRAEIWLNGELLAGQHEAVGTWRRFELDVTQEVNPGAENHLAVYIVPERRTTDSHGHKRHRYR